jgi:hypothetical protein
MLRRNQMIVTAALVAVCAVPAAASASVTGAVPQPPGSGEGNISRDLRSPDARDAAREAGTVSGVRQDLRSPDAVDAAAQRGLYAESNPYVLSRGYGSPDAAEAARDLPPVEVPTTVVELPEPSGGFDWGDAGIGAAGVLGLFSIAAGSALLLVSRRRRRGVQVAAH